MRIARMLWLTVGVLVVTAQPARASIFDIFWEMSGPQLLGIGAQCEVGLNPGKEHGCAFLFYDGIRWGQRKRQRLWLSIEPAIYFSSGKNSSDRGLIFAFRAGRARMFAIDPLVAFKWAKKDSNRVRLYSAAGFSFNRFFGPEVDDFNNVAFKFRPIVADFRIGAQSTLGFTYNFRLYPDGFDTQQRPGEARLLKGRSPEWVHGLAVALSW